MTPLLEVLRSEASMSLSELFHVGVVVPDLDAGCARLTELLGARWGPVLENEIEIQDSEGNDRVVPNRICYSTEPPYLELIQEVPNTPWVCNEHSNLHHVGFFSTALAADSDGLRAADCPLEIRDGRGSAPPAQFTYHRDSLGIRIELVNADLREMMEQHVFRPLDGPLRH
jgi:Glyoxalase/Bleomycin resistance protein/Dioxygenase superfamily